MSYFNEDIYLLTEEEQEYKLQEILTDLFDSDISEEKQSESIEEDINHRFLKSIGSYDDFINAKHDMVKIICLEKVKKKVSKFVTEDPRLQDFEIPRNSQGLSALIKYVLRKNNIDIDNKIEANANFTANRVTRNKNFEIIYNRVGIVQEFLHNHILEFHPLESIDKNLMYNFLTSVRIFMNFSDVRELSYIELINLEKKNRIFIKNQIQKEKDILIDPAERYLDKEIFHSKFKFFRYNPFHPVAKNMRSFYDFIIDDKEFDSIIRLILNLNEKEISSKIFYQLMRKID